MKYIAFVVLVVAAAFSGWLAAQHRQKDHTAVASAVSEHIDAHKIAAMIETADRIGLRLEAEKPDKEISIYDKARIRNFAGILSTTIFGRKEHCLCTGWRTARFYRNNQELLRIAAIHGNQLRLYWSEGGGDFSVSESDWKAVHSAMTMLQTP